MVATVVLYLAPFRFSTESVKESSVSSTEPTINVLIGGVPSQILTVSVGLFLHRRPRPGNLYPICVRWLLPVVLLPSVGSVHPVGPVSTPGFFRPEDEGHAGPTTAGSPNLVSVPVNHYFSPAPGSSWPYNPGPSSGE